MLNGIVGYQLLDDGTAVSLGLMLVSAAMLFVGTGYIALDTGFSWTGYWDDTLTGNNRAYALYTLYQLAPLVFLFVFVCLESYLVLRILGERKPMSESIRMLKVAAHANVSPSVSLRGSAALCHRADLPICDQCAYLQWNERKDQRRAIRDLIHTFFGCYSLGLLVEHY